MRANAIDSANIVSIPPDATPAEILRLAASVRPSPRQKAWQQNELTAFIHFGVNTFSDREWGTGLEDPGVFNPTGLDARQWAGCLADAGFRLVILTAKHHDGFCLWPSRYTDFSVKHSPWKGGQGDVMAELANAAAAFGLKVGVYLSPADLHEMEAPGGRYGNGSPTRPVTIPTPVPDAPDPTGPTFAFEADDYNAYFLNQLYELLTAYGPIHEVWFDGANPKPGVKETYNYNDWFRLVRALAPEAVIFNGPDVRWVGNESGMGRETEWSVLPFQGNPESGVRRLDPLADDLGSRERLLDGSDRKPWDYLAWSPAEVDVSIRPGWFYHPAEDERVKSLAQLMEIYYASVGRNGVLLLNVPPDRRGLFAEPDTARLEAFGRQIQTIFAQNLAVAGTVHASSQAGGYQAANCLDGNPETCWMPTTDDTLPAINLSFEAPVRFDHIVLQECLDVGQRVERFDVKTWDGESWHTAAEGTTIGYKRILRCQPVATRQVQVRFYQSRLSPALASIGLFSGP